MNLSGYSFDVCYFIDFGFLEDLNGNKLVGGLVGSGLYLAESALPNGAT